MFVFEAFKGGVLLNNQVMKNRPLDKVFERQVVLINLTFKEICDAYN